MLSWKRLLHESLCRLYVVVCLLLSTTAFAEKSSILQNVTLNTSTADSIRLTLSLSAPAPYHYFFLQNPNRLVIDFQQTTNKAAFGKLVFNKTVVQHIRAGIRNDHDLRLVFDLSQPASILLTPISATTLNLNISARDAVSTKMNPSKPPAKTAPQAMAIAKPAVSTLSTSKPVLALESKVPRKMVIVIDPGHGGKDPGAIGPSGVSEKDIVLAISRKLYDLLKTQPGVTVHMTRNGDYYVGLRQRLQMARRDKADVFVAIHADAYKDPYSIGASVFALSLRGASSEAARWLAAKENYSELGGVSLDGKGDMLRSVLIDLSQTATISSSLALGSEVLKKVSQVSTLHKGKVEQAPFVVLKSPDIPSILIETGFISNPKEEKNLSNPVYQQKIALAIRDGINRYANN